MTLPPEIEMLGRVVRGARLQLQDHIKPRDETERAIVNALGDCSWDECVAAIQKHRSAPPQPAEPK